MKKVLSALLAFSMVLSVFYVSPFTAWADSPVQSSKYSDIDYFNNLSYEKFKYVIDTLDYSNYVRCKLTDSSNKDRKLVKVKKMQKYPVNILFTK